MILRGWANLPSKHLLWLNDKNWKSFQYFFCEKNPWHSLDSIQWKKKKSCYLGKGILCIGLCLVKYKVCGFPHDLVHVTYFRLSVLTLRAFWVYRRNVDGINEIESTVCTLIRTTGDTIWPHYVNVCQKISKNTWFQMKFCQIDHGAQPKTPKNWKKAAILFAQIWYVWLLYIFFYLSNFWYCSLMIW